MLSEVAVDEREQVVRLGVVGIAGDRFAQRGEGRVVEAAVVEDLAAVEASYRAGGIGAAGPLQPRARRIEIAAGLLRQAELEHGGHIGLVPREQRLELGDRLHETAQRGIGASQLPAALPILRLAADPLAQLGDPAVVVAALPVGDVEVVLRDLHLGVELERLHELADRLLHQTLLVVEHAEVVMRPGIGRIDAAGEGAENGEVALREHGARHRGQGRRMASKIARSDGMSGRSRKCPRRGSVPSTRKDVSTQKTKSRSWPKFR